MKVSKTVGEFITLVNTLMALNGKQHPKLVFCSKVNIDRLVPIGKRANEYYDSLFTADYKVYTDAIEVYRKTFCEENNLPAETKEFGKLQFKFEEGVLAIARDEKYKTTLETFEEGMKGYDAIMQETVELELQLVDPAWLPKRMNLLTYQCIRSIVKDADVYNAHELQEVTFTKAEIISIVQKVLGDGGHYSNRDTGRRPVMEISFQTPVVRRLASFMEQCRLVTQQFAAIRNKHTANTEFVMFMELRNAILRDDALTMEQKIERVNTAYMGLPEESRKIIDGADSEVNGYSDETIALNVAMLRLDSFDEDIDSDVFATLFPIIRE